MLFSLLYTDVIDTLIPSWLAMNAAFTDFLLPRTTWHIISKIVENSNVRVYWDVDILANHLSSCSGFNNRLC